MIKIQSVDVKRATRVNKETEKVLAFTPSQSNRLESGKEKLQINDYYSSGRSEAEGKRYPGRVNYFTQRTMAKNSHTVTSIVTSRTQQVSKLPLMIVPKDRREPSRQLSVLSYKSFDLSFHPALDRGEVGYLREIFQIIDPYDTTSDKRKLFNDKKGELTANQLSIVERLEKKHDEFYKKRDLDIARIEKILNRPDPFFTNTKSWRGFVSQIIEDILVLDRGAFVKIRNEETKEIIGLMPVDGAYIYPLVNEYGFYNPEKAYVQDVGKNERKYMSRDDVVIISMHPTTEILYFGYGKSPMETVYNSVLAEIFIMKGQVDYYGRGGTLPEIILNLKPPSGKDGTVNQLSQEALDDLQRRVSGALLGDTNQIAMIAGLDAEVLDLKGNRKDSQYKELADFVIRNICAVYQASPQDVGILEGIKTSDGEVQADMTRQKGLLTLMSTISENITSEVIDEMRPEQDLKLWFDDDDSKYSKQLWDVKKGMLDANVMTVNEFRSLNGLQPVPWGDVPMQGVQMWESPDITDAKNAADPSLQGMPDGPPSLPGMASAPPGEKQGGPPVMKGLTEHYRAPTPPEIRKIAPEKSEDILKGYNPKELALSPKAAYSRFAETVLKSAVFYDSTPESEVLPLGYESGGEFFVDGNSDKFLVKAIAEYKLNKLSPESRKTLSKLSGGRDLALIELALLQDYPLSLKSLLVENYYSNVKPFSDATLAKARRLLHAKQV